MLVFQDVSMVGRFELLKPASQQNNNGMEISNFAVAIFINLHHQIQRTVCIFI
jgi:hypothetical protein